MLIVAAAMGANKCVTAIYVGVGNSSSSSNRNLHVYNSYVGWVMAAVTAAVTVETCSIS